MRQPENQNGALPNGFFVSDRAGWGGNVGAPPMLHRLQRWTKGQPENGLFAFLQHAIQNFGARPIFGRVDVLHAVAGDFDADASAVENGFLREPCGDCAPVELPCVVPCFF